MTSIVFLGADLDYPGGCFDSILLNITVFWDGWMGLIVFWDPQCHARGGLRVLHQWIEIISGKSRE
ncbi:hypothetical protein BU24DRAFT_427854 [Aaosphaeria arxii CBS 175.79]|uniref:Uncharacterized protein n=1 Tax=Aaosphaeria arxii CBS 175.79 TaxID=1450172 RepID=A0A6A5XA59_9PLEO|nr:uncharacterized protein BU24DRAFT_427854 [Aaosphaeria arxii CBS 175.79]KAF2009831.1 hypothetical protein BU24DRAFT_427854 [Aaosphaeria arxii CBS 175.79]